MCTEDVEVAFHTLYLLEGGGLVQIGLDFEVPSSQW